MKLGKITKITFPKYDNESLDLKKEHETFEKIVTRNTKALSLVHENISGFSISRSGNEGVWYNEHGKRFGDSNLVYTIAGLSHASALNLALWIKEHAKQEAVYYEFDGEAYIV